MRTRTTHSIRRENSGNEAGRGDELDRYSVELHGQSRRFASTLDEYQQRGVCRIIVVSADGDSDDSWMLQDFLFVLRLDFDSALDLFLRQRGSAFHVGMLRWLR